MKNQNIQSNIKLNVRTVTAALACVAMLAACGKTSSSDSGNATQAGASQAQPNSMSQQMLNQVGANIRQNSASSGLSLSDSQILALLMSGQTALTSANLMNSTNLSAIIPVLIQGLSQGVGGLNITNNTQLSQLLSLIGSGTLSSVLGSGSSASSQLMSVITNSLFKNLPIAGVTSGNLSTIVNQLMSSLIGQVGQNNTLPVGNFSTLIQTLLSGAMTGVGSMPGLNLGNLSGILQQIGFGATSGLSGVNLPGGLSSANLQTLLSAMMSGSQNGLSQFLNGNSATGLNLNTLLQSFLQGQMSGVQGLPVSGSIEQILIAFLLQHLL